MIERHTMNKEELIWFANSHLNAVAISITILIVIMVFQFVGLFINLSEYNHVSLILLISVGILLLFTNQERRYSDTIIRLKYGGRPK